jgi:hypothetical protein
MMSDTTNAEPETVAESAQPETQPSETSPQPETDGAKVEGDADQTETPPAQPQPPEAKTDATDEAAQPEKVGEQRCVQTGAVIVPPEVKPTE